VIAFALGVAGGLVCGLIPASLVARHCRQELAKKDRLISALRESYEARGAMLKQMVAASVKPAPTTAHESWVATGSALTH
jgi:hypothetical protein